MSDPPPFNVNAKILLDYVEYKRLKKLANEEPTVSPGKPQIPQSSEQSGAAESSEQSGAGELCQTLGVVPMQGKYGHATSVILTKGETNHNESNTKVIRQPFKKKKKNKIVSKSAKKDLLSGAGVAVPSESCVPETDSECNIDEPIPHHIYYLD